jgi:hypothetical protein
MQGLIVDALTSKRIPAASRMTSLQRAVAEFAPGATHANPNRHAALASDPTANAVTSRGAVSHVDSSKPPKTTRVYDGMMTITGTFSDTNGDKGTWSGTLSDSLSMTVDRSGNGYGYELFSGDITLSVTHADGTQKSATEPLVFSTPDFNLHQGKFQFSQNNGLDFGGLTMTLNLSGSFSNGQAAVSEKLGLPFNGFVTPDVLGSGALKGSSTLTTPPLSITGVATSLSSGGSDIAPFANLAITDLNNATVTATVTLSKTANGRLTNLAGGTYNLAKGTYTITGTEAVVNSALEGLTFDPTIPSSTDRHTTTGFKLSVTDSQGASLPSSTTQVVVTNPLYINGISKHLSTTGTKAVSPFRNVTVSDFTEGATADTVKVTLSNPKDGTLVTSAGGVYNKTTGVFLIHASASAATAALRGLTFVPAKSSKSAVTTTFTLSVKNAAGASITNSSTTVTDNPAALGTVSPDVALFSQYVALGLHAVRDHAAAISPLHDQSLSSHFEFAASHR